MNFVTPDDRPAEWYRTEAGARNRARECEEYPNNYKPDASKHAIAPWAVVDMRPGSGGQT
jgi:hypothetical protein